jgi:hypothetical protein
MTLWLGLGLQSNEERSTEIHPYKSNSRNKHLGLRSIIVLVSFQFCLTKGKLKRLQQTSKRSYQRKSIKDAITQLQKIEVHQGTKSVNLDRFRHHMCLISGKIRPPY